MNLSRIADKCRAADRLLARIDERERNAQVSCGHEQAQADAHLEPAQTGRATAGINGASLTEGCEAPQHRGTTIIELERAVTKYLPEIAKLQRAVDGIAVKESK